MAEPPKFELPPELDQLEHLHEPELVVDSWEKSRLVCPYLLGIGSCTTGCWEEPSCQVDEPERGWVWRGVDGRFQTMPSKEERIAWRRAVGPERHLY